MINHALTAVFATTVTATVCTVLPHVAAVVGRVAEVLR